MRFADEDVAFEIDPARLTRNDTPSGDPDVEVISVAAVEGGTVTLEDGTIRFLSDPDFNGEARFTYVATDGLSESEAAAEVVVRAVNDAPVAVDDGPILAVEDEILLFLFETLLGNDTDIDGDSLSVAGFGKLLDADGTEITGVEGADENATSGVVGIDLLGRGVFFLGSADHFGAAGLSYAVSDGAGGTATANVEVVIQAVNDPPRPKEDAFVTRLDRPLALEADDLIGDDVDPEGHALTLVSVSGAENGTVEMLGDAVTFTPGAGFLGEAGFDYVVEDELGERATGRAVVSVIPLNDPPRAGNDRVTTVEDAPLVLAPSDLLRNDVDPNGDPLTISELDLYPEKGDVAFDAAGNVVFTPDENYNGDAAFHYTISDGRGGFARGEVFVEVLPDNDDPFVADDPGPFETVEDEALALPAFVLFANDGDPDGDVLQFGATEVENGSVRRVGEDLLFTPDADFAGTATVRYRAEDGKGGVSPTFATLEITVTAAPDLPTPADDRLEGLEGAPLVFDAAALLANDTDGDGDALRFVSADLAAPAHGVLTLDGTAFTYRPDDGFWGEDAFTYRVTDDVDGEAEATVTLDIRPDNAAPQPGEDRFATDEDVPVIVAIADLLANDVDPDGDPLSFVEVELVSETGRAAVLPGGRISFAPEADVFGEAAFVYVVTDGITDPVEGRVTLEVAPVNDAPIPVDDVGFRTEAGVAVEIDPAALLLNDRDPEGDPVAFVGVSGGLGGTVTLEGGTIRFAPADGFVGAAGFTYTVEDPSGARAEAQVSVGVATFAAVDDGGFATTEETPIDIPVAALLANDLGPSGAPSLDWADYAVGGDVERLDAATLRFSPHRDFEGAAAFRYSASDEAGATAEAVVSLSVAGVNDAPEVVAAPEDVTLGEEEALSVPLDGAVFADPDGDPLTYALALVGGGAAPDWLEVSGGALSGEPPAGADGVYALEITASDGQESAAVTLTLTVQDTVGETILGDGTGERLVGGPLADRIAAEGGDDRVEPDGGGDLVALGDGADEIAGTAAALDGLTVVDATTADSILVLGAALAPADVTAADGTATLRDVPGLPPFLPAGEGPGPSQVAALLVGLDFDGDGTPDATLALAGAEGRTLEVASEGPDTRIALANRAPTPADDAFAVARDGALSGDVLAGPQGPDSDPDGDALTVTAVDGVAVAPDAPGVIEPAAGGRLTLAADGSFEFDPGDDFFRLGDGESETLAVTYAVSDGTDTAEATLEITVEGSDDGGTERGGRGNDRLTGDRWDDKLIGKGGKDRLNGKGGDDTLKGGGGKDKLIGGGGDDALKGGGGRDRLKAGAGDDVLKGGPGNDKLVGGGGNDELVGGPGNDKLKGGGGEDSFAFSRGDDRDVILDFQDGRDVIMIESGARRFRDLDIEQKGRHALIDYGGRGDVIKVRKTDADDLDAGDFVFG